MDFVQLIKAKQKEINLSDNEVAHKAGISEYTYYNLIKYRIYLSKVAYYTLSCVFELPIVSDKEIHKLLEENKRKVGLPESNLNIAAEYVNPKELVKIEYELARLKDAFESISSKNEVINSQYLEINSLKEKLVELEKDIKMQVQKSYSEGLIEGSKKVENMRNSSNELFLKSLNEEYSDKISKLELALKKSELAYSRLYKEVEIAKSSNIVANLYGFEKPLLLLKEDLGLNLDGSLISDILSEYSTSNITLEKLSKKLGITLELLENIVLNYVLLEKNGVKTYVKRQ